MKFYGIEKQVRSMNYSDDLLAGLSQIKHSPILFIDTETTGLFWHQGNKPFSIIVAGDDELQPVYINLYSYEHGTQPIASKKVLLALQEMLSDGSKRIVAHNAKFDWHMLANLGFKINGEVYDTMTMHRLIDNKRLSYSLDALTGTKMDSVKEWIRANPKLGKIDDPLGTGKKIPAYWRVPYEIIVPYAIQDVVTLRNLYRWQQKQFEIMWEDGIPPAYYIELEATRTIWECERRGILLDVNYALDARKEDNGKAEHFRKQFRLAVGEDFVDSGKAIGAIFERLHITLPKTAPSEKTKKQEYKVDEETLLSLSHPLSNFIIGIRKAEKRTSTYFDNYLRLRNPITGAVHCDFRQTGADTMRMSASAPNVQNCYSIDTEVLTKNGWKYIGDITKGDLIASFNVEKQHIQWEAPTKIHRYENQKFVHITKEHVDLLVTENHRCLFRKRRPKSDSKFSESSAKEFMKDEHILHGAPVVWGRNIPDDIIRLLVAIQADCYISRLSTMDSYYIELSVQKKRKLDRIISILTRLGIKFTCSDRMRETKYSKDKVKLYTIYANVSSVGKYIKTYLGDNKRFTNEWLQLSKESLKVFIEEIPYWDGVYTRRRSTVGYCSKHEENVDIVQAACSLIGYRANIRKYKDLYWIIDCTRRDYSGSSNAKISDASTGTAVCVTVPSSWIVVRRNGKVIISGNCPDESEDDPAPQFPIRGCFIPRPGFKLVSVDFAAQEMRSILDAAEEIELANKILGGEDVHQATADMMGVMRKLAKNIAFGIIYGSGAAKTASQIKCSVDEARRLRDLYFARLPNVRKLSKALTRMAEEYGYIVTRFGNRLFIEKDFAYKAVNYFVQGTCAIHTKNAANKVRDFLVPYKSKILLLIHDELLIEVHHSEMHLIPEIRKLMASAYPHNILPQDTGVEIYKHRWGGETMD